MILEPGYYKEGDFGIRIENVIRIVKATPDGNYLKFDDVTLAPIQLKLIDTKLLTEAEVSSKLLLADLGPVGAHYGFLCYSLRSPTSISITPEFVIQSEIS